MRSPTQLSDVFTPGGLPSVTYVSRDHLELEKKVGEGLARGFAYVVVTGPTKSGKSVLCYKVLENHNLVSLEGGLIRSESDFWAHIAAKLNIASGSSRSEGTTHGSTVGSEASGGIPALLQGKGSFAATDSAQRGSTLSFTNVPALSSIETLLSGKFALLVDDFHYIGVRLQKTIVQSLKGAVFKGLPVVLLAVPHRAFDAIAAENEIEGRFRHVAIPNWALDDLILIPERGFAALNVSVDRAIQRRICEDSFGIRCLFRRFAVSFVSRTESRRYKRINASWMANSLRPRTRIWLKAKAH